MLSTTLPDVISIIRKINPHVQHDLTSVFVCSENPVTKQYFDARFHFTIFAPLPWRAPLASAGADAATRDSARAGMTPARATLTHKQI